MVPRWGLHMINTCNNNNYNIFQMQESLLGNYFEVRLRGGRTKEEGRVEIKTSGSSIWGVICGDSWSIFEGLVVCRQLGLKFAQSSVSTGLITFISRCYILKKLIHSFLSSCKDKHYLDIGFEKSRGGIPNIKHYVNKIVSFQTSLVVIPLE